MKINELKRLNDYFKKIIEIWENSEKNQECDCYLVYEDGVLDLYDKIISGTVSRKDFIIYSNKDMYNYIKKHNIPCASSLLPRFKKEYLQ